jgi:two-component system CheB/CheR fusion protein
MPPNAILTIENGTLRIREPSVQNRERKPIDLFLASLAHDQGEYAAAVILSGGDGDGTLGAKAVKERGGFTLAQSADKSGPRNPDMPESAISSGVIDIALPADEMGGKIVEFAGSFDRTARFAADGGDAREADTRRAREEIYGLLRSHSGHDFSGYKTKTFMRRVARRMQVLQLQSIRGYVDLLRRNPAEITNLFRDLLINVTGFFRDQDAFLALEKLVIPRLFEGGSSSGAVRVWVPGCATGEEVYSIAMLMREHLDSLSAPPKVQIFATDIDDGALAIARAGRYPGQLLKDISPERRERFFNKDGLSEVIASEVRELCIFSPHSVVRDPPFSRIDLVSCRNLLIYLGPDVQNRVIPTFHYSLRQGGYLFLGTSESLGHHGDLFSTLDKKNRIFQVREHAGSRRLPVLIGDPRMPMQDAAGASPRGTASYPLRQAVEARILEGHAPPHVVVNGEGDVVYYSGRTGRYLEPPQGAPSRQILTMARKGLRLDLRAALREAFSTQSTVVRENLIVDEDDNQVQPIRLTIEPLGGQGSGEPLCLVLFEAEGPHRSPAPSELPDPSADLSADTERELRDTRERLQSTIEEYETALEELKSSNEELVSVNEEAQSTNEELEASKEEMQSLNEELNTINAELSQKLEDLDRANSDLRNLFESTRIATVFLDRSLVIRNFTPAASAFFNLRDNDIGRPLTELSNKLAYPDLKEHIASVFASGDMLEHKLDRDEEGRHYLVRLIPYLGNGAQTDGVVVTLVDVTTLAEAEEHQQTLISELNHRVKNMLAVVLSVANHTFQTSTSPALFTKALSGRLHAMARAYGLLSRANWKDASVAELVQQEIEALGAERFRLSGPEVYLKPQQGLSLGMAIHELATNASKYGSLSGSEGIVLIDWNAGDGGFRLSWEERDGPPVEPPAQEGFGLSLIRGEVEYRLRGSVETSFRPEGLKATLSFPLAG